MRLHDHDSSIAELRPSLAMRLPGRSDAALAAGVRLWSRTNRWALYCCDSVCHNGNHGQKRCVSFDFDRLRNNEARTGPLEDSVVKGFSMTTAQPIPVTSSGFLATRHITLLIAAPGGSTAAPVSGKRFRHWAVLCLAATVLMLLPEPTWAQYSESVLYNFCQVAHCSDGNNPGYATLVFDSQGNLYGTTQYGSTNNGTSGVVYKLTPPQGGNGPWTETVIYTFCSLANCSDGAVPYAGVIFDSSGNLYGTTQQGGNSHNDGVVYELTPPQGSNGPWTETVIHTFCTQVGCPDGSGPLAGLTMDSHGNLYGTAYAGGTGAGVIVELSPSGGSWNFSTLYNFCSLQGCADGEEPYTGSLIFDSADNLYGTTEYGGAKGAGTVYELSPSGGG